MAEFVVRGVPRAVALDSWWFAAAVEPVRVAAAGPWGGVAGPGAGGGGTPGEPGAGGGAGLDGPRGAGPDGAAGGVHPGVLLAGLIGLADLLFWHHAPGLSLVVFGLAVAGAVLARAPRLWRGEAGVAVLWLGLSVLPMVEQVQTLSVLIWAAGIASFAVWVAPGRPRDAAAVLRGLGRLAWLAPLLGVRDLGTATAAAVARQDWAARAGAMARDWGLPVLVGLVLAGLLTMANPVIEFWLGRLVPEVWPGEQVVTRPLFWALVAAPVWPMLVLARHRGRLAAVAPMRAARAGAWGVNAGSIARALGLFNAILGVQTGLDAVYLWGGAALPEGIGYAEYAHRGAYPLVATALLAGGFALVSRPYARAGVLRLLLWLWLAQNLALVLSSLLRLELYVEVYGLTYLRIHAAIWMGLVAAGLGLVAWQVWRDLPNGWLLRRTGALLGAVLWVCCFVNFAAIIAAENLDAARRDPGRGLDTWYICGLGPDALAAIRQFEVGVGWVVCFDSLAPEAPLIDGWRDWTWRDARVAEYLRQNPQQGGGGDADHSDRR